MIRLHNIYYAYPDPSGIKNRHNLRNYALKSVSVSVGASERVALLGANGSGKTTLLNVLNGLARPSEGVYYWKNAPVGYSKPFLKGLRRSIATVFQDPEDQLFAGTVYEDVSFGPLNQSLGNDEVHHATMSALNAVGMVAEAQLPLHMLSFGQKKRVALAGAFAMQPELLLLDEPTAGLDPKSEIRLLDIMESKQKQGTTILFSTHDVDLAFEWADKIVILFQGAVVQQGAPVELIESGLDLTQWDLRKPRFDSDLVANGTFTSEKCPLNPPQGDLKNSDLTSDYCLQSPPAGDLGGAVPESTQCVKTTLTTSGNGAGVKAFLVAASSSGTGKTSICSGLGRALRRRGLRVQFCKVGPDYIDPTWLSLASDNQCINLDIWMHGRDGVRARFQKACAGADICIIEGVMGLYDGVDSRSSEGSSADVANLLGVPVVLIADAKGCARSFAAVIHGFVNFPDAPKFIGCIANRVGSSKHGSMIRDAVQGLSVMDKPYGPMFASIPDKAFPSIDSRHLGLHMAADSAEAVQAIERIAGAIEHNVNLDDLINSVPGLTSVLSDKKTGTGRDLSLLPQPRCRLAIAKDDAFCFYYPEWVMALESTGAEVVPFSPLHDQKLPDDCDGLLLGGGYPELYCKKLSENDSMVQSIRNHAGTGKLVYAECGGLMYLSQGIRTADGNYTMLDIMPSWTLLQDRLSRLGYVQATLRKDCMLGNSGDILRGHEFHYSQLESDPDGWECIYTCTTPKGDSLRLEGWSNGNILASYIHLPMDVFPKAIETLIQTTCKGISK
ncbi:MAG TPA: cobyrinate a,c-diamide synthase [Chitinispirillaceae bacterium]|nr:cobyrinate a,c-diamide synthase [Chitinispirillaceae bacterium]